MKSIFYRIYAKVAFIVAFVGISAFSVFGQSYVELYNSGSFTEVATHSYTQNKTFTLAEKSWTASVSQVNSSIFYLGCNSNNSAKGVLNNNSTFSSVVTALRSADATYNTNYTTAHAYALLFENAYSDVTKVVFNWSGGNNAFQVFLFGDSGSGFVLLGSTNYATSGATTAGSVEWTGSATNYSKFAIVARPGATNSTATNKTLRPSSFIIYKTNSSTCAAPTFSPAAGAVLSGTTVSLSTSTDGATIYYTMGNNPADPTTSDTQYSTPLAITEPTTIKAIAVKTGNSNSAVASASYTILTPITTMEGIYSAATSAGNSATPIAVSFNNWVVTGVSGSNAYVTDGTKGFIIFQSNHGFSAGNVLSGTASCKIQLYHGSSEITELTSSSDGLSVSTGGVVTPVTGVSISSLSGVNTGAVYSFDDLSYNGTNLSDGVNTIKPYTTLYSGSFENGKSYNVTGVYLQYDSTKELLPRSAADIEEVVPADPTIIVSTSSLTSFTYEEGSGPSDAKTFTVSGSNLTTNISLSMGGSDYEMSLSSGSGYTTSLTLTPEAGEVASTTIYVRLKADKSAGSYSGSTITLTSTGADDKTVSLSGTVTEYVAPYATLPFAFDGGSGDVAGTAGLTHNGLGSYDSSPKLKFDGTGDYLILQLNERPGVLTYDIKGNSFSGGTFKIQTSVDGSSYTDLKSYTSLSDKESESFSNLASDVRYIKWIYTEKSNGNVALGNIALAVYTPPVPTITVTPSSVIADAEAVAPATEIEGTLAIAYENLTISDYSDFDIEFCDSEGNALASGEEPTWIVALPAEESGDYLVSYVIEENTSYGARSAYFKVCALDDESNIVRSSLITITQSGLPTPALGYAALPFEFTGGRSDIASTDGFTQSGLGSDYASAPSLKFDGTGDYVILHFNEAPGTLTFDIKGNGFSGGTFSVLTSANGEDYSELASYKDLGDTQSEKFTSLTSNIRYIKWIYTEKSFGNVALGNINLTKAAAAETINLTATLSEGRYWVSFFSSSRYTLSEGAQAFTMNSSNQLYRLGSDGSIIPANTAVIIIADTADITLTKDNNASVVTVNGGANILLGSDSPVAKYSLPSGKKAYVLGLYSGTLGFYEFTGDGIPANKAYYLVNE